MATLPSAIWLSVRTREVLDPEPGEPRQVAEVLHGDKVLGQLPVSKVVYEMLPHDLGVVRIDLIVERAQIDTHGPRVSALQEIHSRSSTLERKSA
jgi:hypothetical protein